MGDNAARFNMCNGAKETILSGAEKKCAGAVLRKLGRHFRKIRGVQLDLSTLANPDSSELAQGQAELRPATPERKPPAFLYDLNAGGLVQNRRMAFDRDR